jgi:hypothetical protein
MEMNPQHPVTQAAREQWHKLAALLVQKLGGKAVITTEEIAAIGSRAIVVHFKETTIELDLVTMNDAQAIVAAQGSNVTH